MKLESSMFRSINSHVKWFPLITTNNSGCRMGLTVDNRWVVEGLDGLILLNKPESFIRVIPLLERSIGQVQIELHQISEISNNKLEKKFPFAQIIAAGMQKGAEYWAELAFDWFDELPMIEQQQLVDTLKTIVNAKWSSQRLKHKAGREVRRLGC